VCADGTLHQAIEFIDVAILVSEDNIELVTTGFLKADKRTNEESDRREQHPPTVSADVWH
jgi:hypothetical protein